MLGAPARPGRPRPPSALRRRARAGLRRRAAPAAACAEAATHCATRRNARRSFLEGLLEAGVESFMRLGGRCTSERVERHML